MEKWSKKYNKCRNCGTDRFTHHGRGYCTRCHRVVMRLEQVKRWDLSNHQTLKKVYPYRDLLYYRPDIFEKFKKMYMSQIKARLHSLKTEEDRLSGKTNVVGIDIEMELDYIAEKCGVIKPLQSLFFGIASSVDSMFDNEQKRFFYEQLIRISEKFPWRPYINLKDLSSNK